jgi:hypothetical protein
MTTASKDNGNKYWYIGSYTIEHDASIKSVSTYIIHHGMNRQIAVCSSFSKAIEQVLLDQGWSHSAIQSWSDEIAKIIQ